MVVRAVVDDETVELVVDENIELVDDENIEVVIVVGRTVVLAGL
jgi:hypothetical protein